MTNRDKKEGPTGWQALSRRRFNSGLAAGALALTAGGASLLAPLRSPLAAQKGGRLKVASSVSSPDESLDPAKATRTIDVLRLFQVYNRLVDVGADLKPVGDLAESWEASNQAQEWVFTLRKDVEFHDGRTLKATDVVASIQRLKDPATASAAKSLFDQVESIEADGDLVVRVKLVAPNADLPNVFADNHAEIYPEGFDDFDNAIGTGPFKLQSFTPGGRSVTVRNENYWKSDLPYLDEIETVGIPDSAARVNALLAGEMHLIDNVEPGLIDRIGQTPGLEVLSTKSGRHSHFIMTTTEAPYDNADVRNALKYVVDRQKFLDTVYKGHGQIGNDHPISPIDPFYCEEIPVRAYDPDMAKSLLKKAGAEGTTFELNSSTAMAGMLDGAIVYAEMANQAGVPVKIVKQPTDGYWGNVWMKKPFVSGGWNTRPTTDIMLTIAYSSDAKWNDTNWRRPTFDKLLVEARATTDFEQRKQLYCEAQLMIHEDGGAVIPVFSNLLDAGSTKVKGLPRHPLGSLGQGHFEGVWLES